VRTRRRSGWLGLVSVGERGGGEEGAWAPSRALRVAVVVVVFGAVLGAILSSTWAVGLVLLPCLLVVAPAAGVTTLAARWLDRWEAPTWTTSGLAIAWGAGGAVLLASWIGGWLADEVVYVDDRGILQEHVPLSWVVIPVVEELAKALGLATLMVMRSRLGGLLAGALAGASVGVGFGWVEDASFIAADIDASGLAYGVGTWIVRTLTSPTHAALTVWTGAAFAIAMDSPRMWVRVLVAPAGLVIACLAHGVINYANLYGASDQASFFAALFTASGWIFVVTVVAVIARQVMTHRYRRVLALSTHLDEVAGATVASYPARRAYLRAAGSRGGRAQRANAIRALARWSTRPASGRKRPELSHLPGLE
jgi:RsiW-degrading membrane proteinase PrsW (M82 family)